MKTRKQISWKVSESDMTLIRQVTMRAGHIQLATNQEPDVLTLQMDLIAAHANGCKLDFNRLLEFPDFDFVHDVFGIQRHINRDTGELMRCFVPRCAAK